jgi:hypothetical protein
MILRGLIPFGAMTLAGAVSACGATNAADGSESAVAPEYVGIETEDLDDDLVNVFVALRGGRGPEDVQRYAECAVSRYVLDHEYGFARHLRTNVTEEGGLWRGDAVYTISPTLPRGLMTIDAKVVAEACVQNGIPMV